jgi:hypothetical protein
METTSLYLTAVLGTIIHLAFKYLVILNELKNVKKANSKFNWGYHSVVSLIVLIVIWILIYLKNDVQAILPLTNISVILNTYAGDSALKNILDKSSNKLKKD